MADDAQAREVVESARRANEPIPALGLLGGRPGARLGAPGSAGAGSGAPDRDDLPVERSLGSVLVDGRLHWFVAHLVARRSWWRGRTLAVMNAQWLGGWDLAPRSHPDDGLLDVTDGTLPLWTAGRPAAACRRARTCRTRRSAPPASRRPSSTSTHRSTSGSTAGAWVGPAACRCASNPTRCTWWSGPATPGPRTSTGHRSLGVMDLASAKQRLAPTKSTAGPTC